MWAPCFQGEVRVRSHTCEDWNAQLDYKRVFRATRAEGRPAPTYAKSASTGNSVSPEAGVNPVSRETQEPAAEDVSGFSETAGSRVKKTALRNGLYLEHCGDVDEPTGLSMRFMSFLRRTDEDIINDERHFRYIYGESDWQRVQQPVDERR